MVAILATAAVVILAVAAEALHAARVRRVAALAFGPTGRPARWVRLVPALRALAAGGLAWGLVTLMLLDPKVHRSADDIPESEMRHLLIVFDVSPSMRLTDAGPDGKQTRRLRARDLIESLFSRVAVRQYLTTVVAVYNGAIPVVEKTRDLDVIHNIMDDLPMHHAFTKGNTDLFAGLQEAARIAHPWRPGSATMLVVSDGDTVPSTGMPRMPASIGHVLVLGVGNPRQGSFIDGRHSKQDVSTLRQIAARLGGVYHDGNEKHVGSDLLREVTQGGEVSPLDRLTKREYALAACGLGAAILGLLPFALQRVGTAWRPGVRRNEKRTGEATKGRRSSPREVAGVV
ncbi:MAG: VWA domain-containing protein [Planctomycetia bacterium]|nr:VWA domain-containing protein [Planctomycetia bacterium]